MEMFNRDELDKQYSYCDALLLQFKEPKCYDLEIPNAYEVYSLVNLSLRIILGESIPLSKVNCISTCHENNENIISQRKLESVLQDKEFSNNLFNSLVEPRDEPSLLEYYLTHYNNRFGYEWHCMNGDWFRFRKGEREKAVQRVEKYLQLSQIEKINLIGKTFQQYIGLTNSACRCED